MNSVKINDEPGYTRFISIAEILSNNGFDVELITSTFQHWQKKHRDIENTDLSNYNFNFKFIEEPGYKKNIDLKRVISYKIFARNMQKFLNEEGDYDLIYSVIPPNNMTRIFAEYADKKHIPFIVDVNDLWPEAMRMVIDIPVISDILFRGFYRDAEYVYSHVDGVIGTSKEYASRPFKHQNRDIPKEVVYVGNDIDYFDECVRNGEKIEKGGYWVTYAGTLGTSYDIKTLISAGAILKKKGYEDIKIKILGGGPMENDFKQYAASLDCNVDFEGYLPYKDMACYLDSSDIVVNSVVKKSSASIITKIGDYLASKSPMINTCSSLEFRDKVESDGFGVNVEAEDPDALASAIEYLYLNRDIAKEMAVRGRDIAEKEFNRRISYLKIVDMCNKLLEEENSEDR